MNHLKKSRMEAFLIEGQNGFMNDPLMMLKTTQDKKQDIRKFRPQGPIKPSKKKSVPQRSMNRESNLTDLIDVDIFGEKVDPNAGPLFKTPRTQPLRQNPVFPQQPVIQPQK